MPEPLDLEPIKARLAKYRDSFSPVLFIDSDVENLIAEVERLREWIETRCLSGVSQRELDEFMGRPPVWSPRFDGWRP